VSLEFSDLFLADGALIAFGNDQDVTITHLADAGLLLNGARGLFFNDTTQYINAPNGTTLDIAATDEIELNATLIDINGAVDISGNLDVGGNLVVTGTTTFNGGTLTMGDAATDNVVFGADINSNIIPNTDDTYDLGSSSQEWRNLYIDGTANIDSLVADTADINGGTIDGATIATSDITVGSGKTLNVSAGTLTLADNQISGDKVEGGTIAATTITTLTSTTGNITSVNATTVDTTNLEVTTLKAKDGTAAGSIADSTGVVTLASSVLTTTDINGGTVDGVTIGGSSAGDITYANLSDGTITITAFADEDDMSSDSATLVPTQQSVKAYVDAQVTAQDLDIVGDTGTDAIDLDSETITFAGGTGITSVVTTGTVTHNIDSTVATLTGSQTLTNKSLTAPTLTGTAIVASLDISGDIDVDGTTNLDVVDIDGAVDMATTLTVAGNVDFNGDLDVDGTTNLDVVDIDGAVNMATTALVTGVLTTTAATVFNGGFASNADSTLGTDKKVQFRDSAIYINSSVDGQLDIVADTEIQIAATTVDLNGNLDVSGTALVTGVLTTTAATVFNGGFASNADSTLGTDKKVQFRDAAIYINSSVDGQLDIVADTEIQIAATTVDLNGNLDVSGTALVTGVLTTTAATVFNGGFASNAASTLTVTEDNHVNGLKLINSQAGGYGSALTFQSERSDNNAIVSAAQIRTQGQDSWNSEASADSNLFFATSLNGSLTDKMIIKHDGSVGIGVSAPESIVHIKDSGNVSTILQIESAASQYAPIINFDGIVGASADYLLGEINGSWDTHTNVVSAIRFESGADTTNKDDGLISFWTSSSGPTLTERMRIDASGNVGIGTTSVGTKLNIRSDASDDGILLEKSNGTDIARLFYDGTSTNARFDMFSGGSATVQIKASGDTHFSGGNVGIGTSLPSEKVTLAKSVPNTYTDGLSSLANPLGTHVRIENNSSVTDTFVGVTFVPTNGAEQQQLAYMGAVSTGGGLAPDIVFGRRAASTYYVESMRIDASGRVTMPYQPAFSARPASAQDNIANNESQVTLSFGTEIFDAGSNFASNVFTAPVTGKYQFNALIYTQNLDSAATYFLIAIKTSNRTYLNIQSGASLGADASYYTYTLSILADMDASDTAYIFAQQAGGTSQADIDTDSYFTGYLVA
jgi:hypothetical protein